MKQNNKLNGEQVALLAWILILGTIGGISIVAMIKAMLINSGLL